MQEPSATALDDELPDTYVDRLHKSYHDWCKPHWRTQQRPRQVLNRSRRSIHLNRQQSVHADLVQCCDLPFLRIRYMRRITLGLPAFAVTLVAPAVAEARRLRIPIIRPGGNGEHDGVDWWFWLIVAACICVAIMWTLGRRRRNTSDTKGSVSTGTNDVVPNSLTRAAGRLAREVSEARSSVDSAWANRATAQIESLSAVNVQEASAAHVRGSEAAAHPGTTRFRPVRHSAHATSRRSFGRRS